MFGHYLLVAVRNLRRRKLDAAISIGGLGLAFAAVALIALYILDELSYDTWIPNHERIYQASVGGSAGRTTNVAPSDLGQWIALDFPSLDAVTRLFPAQGVLEHEGNEFNETIYWADANVFDVFDLHVVAGELSGALAEPGSLVLTRRLATKYFGHARPLGETLLYNGSEPLTVTAVIEDLPSNTHLRADAFAAGHTVYSPAAEQDRNPLQQFGAKLWNTFTYVLVPAGGSVEALREGIPDMLDRRTPDSGGRPVSENYSIMLRPVAAIHLSPGIIDGPRNDLRRIYTIAAIGVLILLAGSINFINLLTAFGLRRASEVGVRKAMGAGRLDLFAQFMSESFLYVVSGGVVGLALAEASLPRLNAFLGRGMELSALSTPGLAVAALAFLVLVALLAGVYPSIVLSAFRPSAVVSRSTGGAAARVRQVLVVLQFAILTGLLIATAIMYRQLQFGMSEALRRSTETVVIMNGQCTDAFKNEVLALPGVLGAACSWQVPQMGVGPTSAITPREGETFGIRYTSIDFGFFELYGLEPVAGRFFSPDLGTDVSPADNVWTRAEALVVNETAVARLGFASAEEAVGQLVSFNHLFRLPATFTGFHDARIVGVVEDFQIGSVQAEIPPAAFYVDPAQSTSMSISIDGQVLPEVLQGLDAAWEASGAPGPPQRYFFEAAVQSLYLDVRRQTHLLSVFAGIAVLIAMLGLVGLAAHAAAVRTKEIGVRKVLGGTRLSIVSLLLWQFAKPVLVANVVAWPAAYFGMSLWLRGFARRVDPEPWIFVAAAGLTVLVALLTVCAHSYMLAGVRPVSALRHE